MLFLLNLFPKLFFLSISISTHFVLFFLSIYTFTFYISFHSPGFWIPSTISFITKYFSWFFSVIHFFLRGGGCSFLSNSLQFFLLIYQTDYSYLRNCRCNKNNNIKLKIKKNRRNKTKNNSTNALNYFHSGLKLNILFFQFHLMNDSWEQNQGSFLTRHTNRIGKCATKPNYFLLRYLYYRLRDRQRINNC